MIKDVIKGKGVRAEEKRYFICLVFSLLSSINEI
jgi:hypothetical protein